MTTRIYNDERRWANTDRSLHFNHHEPRPGMDWRGVYIYCLKMYDYDAAELIKIRNMISDECSDGECPCPYRWCSCAKCHSANQSKLEHPHLRSLAEVESEREEDDRYALG